MQVISIIPDLFHSLPLFVNIFGVPAYNHYHQFPVLRHVSIGVIPFSLPYLFLLLLRTQHNRTGDV